MPRLMLVSLSALLALSLLGGCGGRKKSPEERIRERVDESIAGLEQNDLGKAGDILHESYRDSAGRDRRAMKGLALIALRQGKVRIALRDVKIEVEPSGKKASFTADVFIVQGAASIEKLSDVLPKNARQQRVVLSLVEDGGKWYVMSLEGDGLRSELLE